jgi:hypothetical protein
MIYVAIVILLASLMSVFPSSQLHGLRGWLIFSADPAAAVTLQASSSYAFTQMNSVSLIAIALFIMAGASWNEGASERNSSIW